MLKAAAISYALVMTAGLIFCRYAPAQECCPVARAMSAAPAVSSRAQITVIQPLIGQAAYFPPGLYLRPYNPVYRGRLYEFTGHIVNGVPVYRQMP